MFSTLAGRVTRAKVLSFAALFLLVLSLGSAYLQKADAAKNKGMPTPTPDWGTMGKWTIVATPTATPTPIVSTHMSVLPNGKVLSWGAIAGGTNQTIVQIWNPDCTGNCFTYVLIDDDFDSLYCSGHSFLPDGKLLVAGGTPFSGSPLGTDNATLYDYSDGTNGSWTAISTPMNNLRWYPTALSLPSGGILVWGGHTDDRTPPNDVNTIPQILEKQVDGTYTWRDLKIASPEPDYEYYSWLHSLSSGKALVIAEKTATSYLLTYGGAFRYPKDFLYKYPFHASDPAHDGELARHEGGSSIQYDKDKIIAIGGAFTTPVRTVEAINVGAGTPAWATVGRLNIRRRWHNSTVLPDGKVLVTGGNKGNQFNNTCSANWVKEAEVWDPADPGTANQDGKWTLLAAATEARIYHSAAVLLPDARILTGGTSSFVADGDDGATPTPANCPTLSTNNHTLEIFSPPYLFNSDGTDATRPVINSGNTTVGYGGTYTYNVSNAGTNPFVSFIRLPSVTHGFNQNQGIVKMTLSGSGSNYSVTMPANRNEMPPGWYMMFFLTNAAKPVPSVAKMVQIL